MSGKTLTFSAAKKFGKPGVFSTMVKPFGSSCNLRCAYCYYLDKADLYGGKQPLMSDSLLEEYIKQYIDAVEIPAVSFCWHGGEPLMAGVDFFRKAMELQKKYQGDKKIENSLQTNGLLMNEEWCEFFRDNQFLIGLSIDGPQDIHDAFRQDRGGHPTFEKVVRAAEMMNQFGVDFNILSTVNAKSKGRGKDVYNFLKQFTPFLQFLPVLEYIDERGRIVPPEIPNSHPTPYSINSEDFGRFICDVYDEWVKQDVGKVYVQLFDNTLAQWCGQRSTLCALGETCGDGLIVEHNGDVYCCDHFVYPQYKIGNILHTTIKEMSKNSLRLEFSAAKMSDLPKLCQRCQWLFLCHGECPKHRFSKTGKGEDGLNTFCKGYKMFFEHTAEDMKLMRKLLEHQLPPALIMDEKQ